MFNKEKILGLVRHTLTFVGAIYITKGLIDETLVTEIVGEDGNDHKKAILRHTYELMSNKYSIKKEVKFEGSEIWIKRNEYLLKRSGN